MPAPSSAVAHHRARVGALSRDRHPDDPEFVSAKRDLAAANLEEHVNRVLAGWPPLSEQQLDRIAAILRAGSPGGAA
jgi:hypothetical protein